MKYLIPILALFLTLACSTKKEIVAKKTEINGDTIRIANDALEYEVVIIDARFSSWLAGYAKPRTYFSQNYMEQRNRTWVSQWNQNVATALRPNLFEMSINYDSFTDYGYEVNYLLYNYLTYFQLTNNIQLGGFRARL